ncbi:MAG TPA: adenylate/guanylate cyclase domain-containing protein [Solirubrobacteraceae bacterium]|nr:adenylate/guanylate cyclase domain-containing protein [Solirubrobacteraceae bacterium]
MIGDEACPLPGDDALAAVAGALDESGHWAEIFDADCRYVFMTENARWIYGLATPAPVPLGAHVYSAEAVQTRMDYPGGHFPIEIARSGFLRAGPWLLAASGDDRAALRAAVDPRLRDLVDEIEHAEGLPAAYSYTFAGVYGATGIPVEIRNLLLTVRRSDGSVAGYALVSKPAVGMATLARLTALGDLEHFERMGRVLAADRRPAAILFADVESSSPLSRRLPSAAYFELGRHIARAADRAVIDAGGLVGRHVGDGVVAFFLAEIVGSESAAARGCIEAARTIGEALPAVARESELPDDELRMRFGLHWGATIYVGQIVTSGRTEVTGLGDDVNDAARIEACATGGRLLASKQLVERLDPGDAAALGLDLDRVKYTALADLPSATDKARRDAPAIAVCEV